MPTTYGEELAKRVRKLMPNGVDAAIDVTGSKIIPEQIRIIGGPEHVLSVADFSAEEYGAKFSCGPPVDQAGLLKAMAELWSSGLFRLHIDQTFPLERAKDAQVFSQSGHATGKLVVCCG